jgi:hypothetical protein
MKRLDCVSSTSSETIAFLFVSRTDTSKPRVGILSQKLLYTYVDVIKRRRKIMMMMRRIVVTSSPHGTMCVDLCEY